MPATMSVSLTPWSIETELRMSIANGGGNKVLREATGSNEGNVTATDPVSLAVDVAAFRGQIDDRNVRLAASTESDAIEAPAALDRIDLVQYTYGTGVNIKTGAENASPVAPTVDAASISHATIYCRPAMTSIKDTDDASNGYITNLAARYTGS